jgi:hypothetical protein
VIISRTIRIAASFCQQTDEQRRSALDPGVICYKEGHDGLGLGRRLDGQQRIYVSSLVRSLRLERPDTEHARRGHQLTQSPGLLKQASRSPSHVSAWREVALRHWLLLQPFVW